MKKTKKKKNRTLRLGLPIAILVLGWSAVGWWLWVSSPPQSVPSLVRVTIPDGTSSQAIAQKLEEAGIIRSGLALRLLIQWEALQGSRSTLRAGTYELPTNLSMREVVEQLQSAQSQIKIVRLTIPEGWNLRQIAQYCQEEGLFSAADFLRLADRPPQGLRPWLTSDIPNLEGFLFPDTYEVVVGVTTPESLINTMLDRFEQVALPIHQAHHAQVPLPTVQMSLRDWVALASIVEKEVILESERRLVAGVFWRRLRKNMRLESDPTVEYGLRIRQTKEQPLTLDQVRTPHPYNTYLNEGIPPGAISAPGLASLKAVLQPESTEYLFFVARYDGSHTFSRSFAEHQKQIEAIDRQIKNNKKDKVPKN